MFFISKELIAVNLIGKVTRFEGDYTKCFADILKRLIGQNNADK